MIYVGTKCQLEQVVTNELTAAAVGSGLLPVFGTPYMSGLMENAAQSALGVFLEEGQGSVGTELNICHISATPVGLEVRAEAEVTAVDGNTITFQVTAFDECGKIGEGTHKRVLVNVQRFLDKAYNKL